MSRVSMLVALTLAGLGGMAASASGATVAVGGGMITYTAAAGELNHLTVTVAGGNYVFDELVLTVTPGSGCSVTGLGDAQCPLDPSTGVTIDVLDGTDIVTAAGLNADPFVINGGSGDNLLTGSAAGDTINGGSGHNTLHGNGGNDTINAGDGNDILNGDDGSDMMNGGGGDDALFGHTALGLPGSGDASSDRMNGGAAFGNDRYNVTVGGLDVSDPGIDRVIYSDATEGVTVTFGTAANTNTANDGSISGGFSDNVGFEVESLTGSSFRDVVTGGSQNNTFSGGGGDDSLSGLTGDDFLVGGLGGDDFFGGAGTDRVTYRADGNDLVGDITVDLDASFDDGHAGEGDRVRPDIEILFGDEDDDVLDMSGYNGAAPPAGVSIFGYEGDDTLTGTAGADALDGGPDTDTLNCGAGADTFLNGETTPDCP